MRWAEEVRLDFIDLTLIARGEINRADLIDRFGISPSQASGDLSAFMRLHRGAMEYDANEKRYIAADDPYRSRRGQDDPRILDALAQLAAAGSRLGWRP